jgi:dGTP triphosphohydrolase
MLSLDEALRFLGITPSQDTPERALVDLRVAIIGELTKYALQRFMANLEGIDMGTFDEELLDGNELCEQLGKLEFERIFRHDTIAQAELKGAQVMNSILDRVLPLLMAPKPDWRLNAIISPSMTRLVLAEEYQKRVSANPAHNASANPSSNPVPLTELSDLSTYNRLRLIIDWLSGMTDRYALETYHRLLAL